MLTKKSCFLPRAAPSKLVCCGAEGAYRKLLESVSQKWMSQKGSKGEPFGSAGGPISEERNVRPQPLAPPTPNSAPSFCDILLNVFQLLFVVPDILPHFWLTDSKIFLKTPVAPIFFLADFFMIQFMIQDFLAMSRH